MRVEHFALIKAQSETFNKMSLPFQPDSEIGDANGGNEYRIEP